MFQQLFLSVVTSLVNSEEVTVDELKQLIRQVGKAILNYERALVLAPDDEDVKYNIELAKAKTTDQFNKPSEMFFITWLRDWVVSKNTNQWGTISIVLLAIGLFLFGIYRFSSHMSIKKIGFFLAMFCFVGVVITNMAAAWNYSIYQNDPRAVIIKTTELYKTSNDKEEALRELHPGTIIEVTDENSRGWIEIEMPNGKKGWIKQADAIKIKNSK